MNEQSGLNKELVEENAFLKQKIQKLEYSESERKLSELELKTNNEHLEKLIDERTAELIKVNDLLRIEIAERKQVDDNLSRAMQYLTAHMNNSPLAFIEFDLRYHVTRWSKEAESLFGWTSEEVMGRSNSEIVWGYEANEGRSSRESNGLHNSERFRSFNVNRNYRKDGSVIHCEWHNSGIYDSHGKMNSILSLVLDITNRKKAEDALRENEQKLRNLADNLPNAMVYQLTAEPDGGRRFTYVSRAVERLNETTEEEVLADAGILYGQVLPEYRSMVRECEENALKNLTTLQVEVQSRLPSGRLRWFEYTSTPSRHASGIIVWNGVQVDITDRKMAEEMLKESLREKNILLNEIHHRVKNNMQVISGLLDLQARSSEDPKLIEMLKESRNRISSMALIHEKLYDSKNFARIDLADYVSALSQGLFRAHKINPGEIDLIVQTDVDVYIDIIKAIPCGLILNELISNALKHAFTGNRQGELKIILSVTKNEEIEIIVRDNGLGLPYDIDIDQPRSAGLHLVNGLVKNQLDGRIEVKRDNGTEFRITY